MNRKWLLTVLSAVALVAACGSAENDWNQATAANTVAAYEAYLQKHPDGNHRAEADARITKINETDAWNHATQANTVQSYQDYLQRKPDGEHAQQAKDSIESIQRANDWSQAKLAGTTAALQDFLRKHDKGTEADQARQQLASMTAYRVQLASAKSQLQAEHQRVRLQSKYGKVVHEMTVTPARVGSNYLVVSTPMSETDANSTCAKLRHAHSECTVVPNEGRTS
jgi:SPOR domain